MDFAVTVQGEETGRWVLAVDSAGERLLLGTDDNKMRWVRMSDCKVLKVANPEVARPVVMVQPVQPQKIAVPRMVGPQGNGRG